MSIIPVFPEFAPLTLADRAVIQPRLWAYQPTTSELTFSNLFLWQDFYNFRWCLAEDYLLVLAEPAEAAPWFLPPIGLGPRADLCRRLMNWLSERTDSALPTIARADGRLAQELLATGAWQCQPQREHFDYVYRTADLINLSGNKYHSKRNHINNLRRRYRIDYQPLTPELLPACLALAERWCAFRRCEEDLSLKGEWEAIQLALANFQALNLSGAALLINGRVEAFALGELLNATTAVIHIEKANPEIRELYSLINQQFCAQTWKETDYINREQDLGEEGLRRAKMSYHPHHLEEKYLLWPLSRENKEE